MTKADGRAYPIRTLSHSEEDGTCYNSNVAIRFGKTKGELHALQI